MAAQSYWSSNNQGDDSHQHQYPQHDHTQNNYDPSYVQNQPYHAPQPPEYGQANEQLNWGYGGDTQQTYSHYESHTITSYDGTHQNQSYDHNQNQNYDPSQNPDNDYSYHDQAPTSEHDRYRAYNPYDAKSYSPQPPAYNQSRASDYVQNHSTTNPYSNHEFLNVPPSHAYTATSGSEHGHDVSPPSHAYSGTVTPVLSHSRGHSQADGERGILGAIGGAAAGGYAGHQVNHGFVGALGGAYAGHKLEEKLKKDKKKKKDKTKHSSGRRYSSTSDSSSDDDKKKKKKHGATPAKMAGNFSASCTQISLDRDYDLIASCATVSGKQKLSSISLDSCIGNAWGEFQWSRGGGFAKTSRNVRLVDGGKALEAELGDGRGGWKLRRLNLNERITNSDGDLQYMG